LIFACLGAVIEHLAGRIYPFELDRSAGVSAVPFLAQTRIRQARRLHPSSEDFGAAQLALNRRIEHGEVTQSSAKVAR
jgi:hypothetical protein